MERRLGAAPPPGPPPLECQAGCEPTPMYLILQGCESYEDRSAGGRAIVRGTEVPTKLFCPRSWCSPPRQVSGTFKRGVTERGVFAFACQYIVSPRGQTGNRTVTQMLHPLLVEGRPNCTRQSLASALSAPRVAATSYCHPGRHANVITPCLLTPCLNVPKSVSF